MLPQQVIPDSEKTDDWAEQCGKAIVMMARKHSYTHNQSKFCYNFYNGNINQSDFDYLRKSGDFEYPALVRHVPLFKPMWDRLKSEEILRPFNFRAYTVDSESIGRKKDAEIQGIIQAIEKKIEQKKSADEEAEQQIEMYKEQIAQSEQQGQIVDFRTKKQIALLEKQIKQKIEFSDKELNALQKYYKLDYKDDLEILSEKGLKYLIKTQNIPLKFNQGFEDKLVTNYQYYFIDYDQVRPDPTLKNMDPVHFYHSHDNVDWVHQCQWGMYEELLPLNKITDRWPKIDKDTITQISNRTSIRLDYGSDGYYDYAYSYAASENLVYFNRRDYNSTQIVIRHCFWMSPKIFFFYTDADGIEQCTKDKKEIPVGVSYEERYMNVLWYAVLADGDIVIQRGEYPIQIYDNNYVHAGLPFTGPNLWGRKEANSLVWQTKDIQIMYNLVHYHKELWLALSGVKGFIMDKSQLPDDMTEEEWMYMRKQGIAWIETVKKNRKVPTTFNQFQTYDDSVSASIQYLLKILEHYENLAYTVTGVPRQMMGSIVNTDQVGTTDAAISQGLMTTQIMFIEHEAVKRVVLQKLLQVCKVTWNIHGKKDQFVDDDMTQVLLDVPKGLFGKADYNVYITDGAKEQKALANLQSMAAGTFMKQGIDMLPAAAKIMMIENVKELEAQIEHYCDVATERMQSMEAAKMNADQQKVQMQNEHEAMIEKQNAQFKQMEMQISRAELDFKIKDLEYRKEFDAKKLEEEIKIKKYEIDSEKAVEAAYLDFQKKEAVYNAELEKLRISLDSVNKHLDLQIKSRAKEKIKD